MKYKFNIKYKLEMLTKMIFNNSSLCLVSGHSGQCSVLHSAAGEEALL